MSLDEVRWWNNGPRLPRDAPRRVSSSTRREASWENSSPWHWLFKLIWAKTIPSRPFSNVLCFKNSNLRSWKYIQGDGGIELSSYLFQQIDFMWWSCSDRAESWHVSWGPQGGFQTLKKFSRIFSGSPGNRFFFGFWAITLATSIVQRRNAPRWKAEDLRNPTRGVATL